MKNTKNKITHRIEVLQLFLLRDAKKKEGNFIMKKNSLMLIPVLMTVGGANMFAAETTYPNAKTAVVESVIEFTEDDGITQPVDPTDPTVPVDPIGPTNPNGAELMITYASKLDFGSQEKAGTSFHAVLDEMKDGEKITPFVSIKDARGTEREGWTLSAKIDGDFVDSKGNPLKGATVTFSNLFSGNGHEGAPNPVGSEIELDAQSKEIASASADNGIGLWSVGLGKAQSNGTTNGVVLTVPSTTAKNTASYSTSVTYTLAADPTK